MGSVSPIYPIFASRPKSSKSREIRITKRRKRRQRQQNCGSPYCSCVAKCVWCFSFTAMIALSAFEFHESKGIHFSNHRYWRIPCGIKGQIKSANTAGQVLIMKIATVSVIHGNMWKAWKHESIANKNWKQKTVELSKHEHSCGCAAWCGWWPCGAPRITTEKIKKMSRLWRFECFSFVFFLRPHSHDSILQRKALKFQVSSFRCLFRCFNMFQNSKIFEEIPSSHGKSSIFGESTICSQATEDVVREELLSEETEETEKSHHQKIRKKAKQHMN